MSIKKDLRQISLTQADVHLQEEKREKRLIKHTSQIEYDVRFNMVLQLEVCSAHRVSSDTFVRADFCFGRRPCRSSS